MTQEERKVARERERERNDRQRTQLRRKKTQSGEEGKEKEKINETIVCVAGDQPWSTTSESHVRNTLNFSRYQSAHRIRLFDP